MKQLKLVINKFWLPRMILLIFFRPKRFMLEFVYSFRDYQKYKQSLENYKIGLKSIVSSKENEGKGLLVVAGHMMSAQWLQIWVVLGGYKQAKGYKVYALTSKGQPIQNLYFKILNFKPIYLEDLDLEKVNIPETINGLFARLLTFQDFKTFEIEGIPYGKMALSTFSRHRATGIMDIDDAESRKAVILWLERLYKATIVAEKLHAEYNISMLYFTEVFMEEYGSFYYAALKSKLNIIRFAGTVRDDSIVVQHMNEESDRTHFSSISKSNWESLLKFQYTEVIEKELSDNFNDRYGSKWGLSKRNQLNTKIVSVQEARASLSIPESKKIAIIYSHILYDTLFFNGEDLFDNYADWLVQTVKEACKNDQVQWYIKVHPSNLWRGELDSFLNGKFEEVRLIEEFVGDLPDHVRFIYPDTELSPFTWLQLADFGITVRGTSGIELGALGKSVITAGSGRYEDAGFTFNSDSINEYLTLLGKLPNIPALTDYQKELGRRFAYATFCLKPYTLDFFSPKIRVGRKSIFSSDDLVFLGNFNKSKIPDSILNFYSWSQNRDIIDFLRDWPVGKLKTLSDY